MHRTLSDKLDDSIEQLNNLPSGLTNLFPALTTISEVKWQNIEKIQIKKPRCTIDHKKRWHRQTQNNIDETNNVTQETTSKQ